MVRGKDLTDPKVVAWMRDFQAGLLARYGYSSKHRGGKAELCPALSLHRPVPRRVPRRRRARRCAALLDAVPAYFSQAVITKDRRTANLAFGVRLVSLERQQAIFDDIRSRLKPPAGVTARLGRPAGADRGGELDALGPAAAARACCSPGCWRWRSCCSHVYRSWERALVPLVPIALATGWSALVLFAIRVPLNPMSATLGALVIAISTEFAVLLSARFREERSRGLGSAGGAAGRPTRPRARPCSPRGRRRSPASPCSRSPT